MKQVKKILIALSLLGALPYILSFSGLLIFGWNIYGPLRTVVWYGAYLRPYEFGINAVSAASLVVMFGSLLYYKTRRVPYMIWISLTAVFLALTLGQVVYIAISPPRGGWGLGNTDMLVLGFFALMYVILSLIIWLFGFLTRHKHDRG